MIMMMMIIIIILVIPFMQAIHNYVPKTNHISRVHIIAAVMYLKSLLYVALFHP
jgi:hypothetical protein